MSKSKSVKPSPFTTKELSQWLTQLENGIPAGISKLRKLYSKTGHAYKIGVTGPPGVGKSTVIDRLIEVATRNKQKIAVLAVDPSNPDTSGAFLGDRIRMQRHSTKKGVFIRSLASRHHQGGLTTTIRPIMHALDIAGFDLILLETVGTGQDEIEIRDVADITVVLLSPGSGDSIQLGKSGILDVGDIIAINKSDMPESASMLHILQTRFASLKNHPCRLLSVSGATGAGIEELYLMLQTIFQEFQDGGELAERRKRQALSEVLESLKSRAVNDILRNFHQSRMVSRLLKQLEQKETDPYSIIERVYQQWKKTVEPKQLEQPEHSTISIHPVKHMH